MTLSLAFARVCELGHALGVSRICDLQACWEHNVDEQWRIAVNAHREPSPTTWGAKVPAMSVYVEFNEWPAGVIGPGGGPICAGAVANEDTFIAALEAAIVRAGGTVTEDA